MPPTLTDAITDALRPSGLAERARVALTGGLTPLQILSRLPPDLQASLSDNPNETLARREAVHAVTCALDALIEAGRARRRRLQLKNALVDVYRLT